ncbi:Translation factor GUF1 -like protein, mitochondrial [Toxocara canis]|uniref:Translation factor GUF1 homolog, mitochondrial n=1 Tax=Toxocara canis TaxID=6265 RepID=A0A0B2VRX4_TOXCA|nr:Translation factor GUF1 -like protein, mitochondrial [Toxocara canis]
MRWCCWRRLLPSYGVPRRCASKLSRSNDPNRLVDVSHFTPDKIRNFGIVAHVDHGKSTLADRLLELTGVVDSAHEDQLLDRLQVERERGITVKAQTCSMVYKDFLLNLIDTPGHADFNFEVSRSLAASSGILLLVAANQGVQAQTIANFWLAFERGLAIIPLINKIDLKGVNIAQVEAQMQNLFEFEANDIIHISAKSGDNVPLVLDSIIQRIAAPNADRDSPFRCMIYDSWFDKFRGAVACVLVKEGSVARGDIIRSFHAEKHYEVVEVGVMHPGMTPVQRLYAGQVGYIIANMKTVKEAAAGETLFIGESRECVIPLPGFKPVKPTVYAGLFPLDAGDYDSLKQAVEQLALNDPSVTVTPDSSPALGLGWRIGFLGVLHMEVFSSRLEQEYGANVVLTAPNVEFRAVIKDNETIRKKRYEGKKEIRILDPSKFPDPCDVERFLEPMVKLTMLIPSEHMGAVNAMCAAARGRRGETQSIDERRLALTWRMPLAEIVVDFFERLKRITSGYVSFDYELDGHDEIDLVKMSISINGALINEFSQIIPAPMLRERAKLIVSRLKKEIPRQQFEVVLRATVGNSSKAVTQAIIPPMRKDFTQLLKGNFGGGGMERLNKKLSHQKKGKERMKLIGRVQIPKEAFINVLRN